MKLVLVSFIFAITSCSTRSYLRVPATYHSKYEAFTPGMTIKLRVAVERAHKEEKIYSDDKCEIHKYCTFEIDDDPYRRLTMKGTFKVDSINEEQDKLVLLTKENEKIQLDCGLKYTTQSVTVDNDHYCEEQMRGYKIYTFPEFMQTIVDMEYHWPES